MAGEVLASLADSVTRARGAMQSGTVLINGIATRMQAAVDKALLNGATAEQLAPVTDEIAALNTDSDALAAAVVANP